MLIGTTALPSEKSSGPPGDAAAAASGIDAKAGIMP
jgi:hypothetical protein